MIWVIGGTKDSRDFLEEYTKYDSNVIVSTATEYGGKLLENLDITISTQKMNLDEMLQFLKDYSIQKIVDVSHPYAYEVSKNAMRVAEMQGISYYRFERKEIELCAKKYSKFKNLKDLLHYVESLEGNILVTLGSNNVPSFQNLKNLSKIYFRILPKWDMVKRCEEHGILPKNIIAMQGPFTENMNIAMLEQLQIQYLITKQAGDTGGEREKISACDKKGIEVIYLEKEKLEYKNCYFELNTLIEALKIPSK
ncbi:precorrin-6A reductase [Fusobacterium gonidiaformans 3-1-5R]|uniref:Precorrin-6A reductase n=1 Tax=Fusobacterium gonidiaformans 3-1-5R TaxID=469605 RepID=E5BH84_9FUSO|nr:precorrin-6A reductase [Fusobacterium gonidiaformans]EFS21857.1 precorrin-6A reductase [Fusobacterium gonidiaformans 3-1-5R]